MNTAAHDPLELIPIDQVEVGDRLRTIDPDHAALIAESFRSNGQMTPIEVRRAPGGGFRLIAGAHRLEAASIAGMATIAAVVVEADDDQARLREIDENLCRRDLSELDRAVFLAERKRIYEALHPEARRGGARRGTKTTSLSVWSFSKATAQKLGVDERTIQRAVARAAIHPEARAMLAGSPAADSGAELDKIAALPPPLQIEVARRLGGQTRTVAAAMAAIHGPPAANPAAEADRQHAALMSAWRKAGRAARRRFVDFLVAEGEINARAPEAA